MEYADLNENSKVEQERHAELLQRYEAHKRARTVLVPTAIADVKSKLRELGHPITLFGEDHADRRERLKELIGRLEVDVEAETHKQKQQLKSEKQSTGSASHKEIFYSPASDELINARKDIGTFSFQRAQERLNKIRDIRENDHLQYQQDNDVREVYMNSKELALNASQFGDDRPITAIRYSGDGNTIASGSLTATVKLWDAEMLSERGILRGHIERITSVEWHPNSSLLASSSADGTCKLWDCSTLQSNDPGDSMDMDVDDQPKLARTLTGHQGIVSKCEFHPNGRFIGTACHDFAWRLFDTETGSELLLQDGHIKECSAISFHPDGSLVLTGDSGGLALLWDLRSGQCIQPFQGHIKKITGASSNSNGFQIATCSMDNTVKIWDLRKRKCGYTLPAHSNIISDVKFSQSGETLVSCSFDGTVKIWSARDYQILRTLSGHEGKVMACDIQNNEKYLISGGYDRTIKRWAHKDEF